MLRKLHLCVCPKGCVAWSLCHKEEISFVNLPEFLSPEPLSDWHLCLSLPSPSSPVPSVALFLDQGSPTCPGVTHGLLL